MGLYQSRFATRGTRPRTGHDRRVLRRVAVTAGTTALLVIGVLGLWRGSIAIPDPRPIPPPGTTIDLTR